MKIERNYDKMKIYDKIKRKSKQLVSCLIAVFTEKTSSKSNKNYMDGEEQTQ